MRIVETKEEGDELISRFKKACSLLEELPVHQTASIIVVSSSGYFWRGCWRF